MNAVLGQPVLGRPCLVAEVPGRLRREQRRDQSEENADNNAAAARVLRGSLPFQFSSESLRHAGVSVHRLRPSATGAEDGQRRVTLAYPPAAKTDTG